MDATRDQAGKMRHIDHQGGPNRVGYFAKTGKIDDPRIGRTAGDDDFRPMRPGKFAEGLEIDPRIIAADTIRHRIEPFS